jgi:hypothetical protein
MNLDIFLSGSDFVVSAGGWGVLLDSRTEDERTTGGRVGREVLGVAGNDVDEMTVGGLGFAGLANDGDSTIIDGMGVLAFANEGDSTIMDGIVAGKAVVFVLAVLPGTTKGALVFKGDDDDGVDDVPTSALGFVGGWRSVTEVKGSFGEDLPALETGVWDLELGGEDGGEG